jgi:hypothetical protein
MPPIRRISGLLAAIFIAACGPSTSTTGPSSQATSEGIAPTDSPIATVVSPSPDHLPSVSPTGLLAADLDGVFTMPDLAHRLPLVVSIDDSRQARPQSGFNAASIVWQAPVDGYESRYLLVLQEAEASSIGPVRSARFYLAHWAAELDAGFAHFGGDRMTRAWLLANQGALFTNVDGIGAGNPAFHRISERVAPHNAYTSSSALLRNAIRLGADPTISDSVHLRPFRDDLLPADRGPAATFSIPYNTVDVSYRFQPQADDYQRYTNGKPQVDPMDDQRVTARTIVVLFMPFHTDSTIEAGHNRPVLGFIGSGVAWVFSEGKVVVGTWSKPSELAPTEIIGPDGQELPLVRGRIFMQVVPLGTNVVQG